MLTLVITTIAICLVFKTEVGAINCKNYDLSSKQPLETSLDCADPQNGDNREKCLLRVVTNTTSSQSSFWKSCMKKDTPESVCGQTAPSTTTPGISIKYCCCDTDNCNNDAFAQQCALKTPTPSGFQCNMKMIQNGNVGVSTKMSCSDKNFGDNLNKCVVYVNETGSVVSTNTLCLPKAAASQCGSQATVGESKLKICCCDTENCNDDDFVSKCKDGTAPTSSPAGFPCHMKTDVNGKTMTSGTMDCSNKLFGDMANRCVVYVNQTGSDVMTNAVCLPKIAEPQCGSEASVGASKMRICCCDTANCNDDTFVQKCKDGTAPTSAPSGLRCHLKTEVDGQGAIGGIMACSLLGAGVSNTCAVTIMQTSTNKQVASTCIPDAVAVGCGLQATVNGNSTKVCCCNTDLCNDDNFVKHCAGEISSGVSITAGIVAIFASFILYFTVNHS